MMIDKKKEQPLEQTIPVPSPSEMEAFLGSHETFPEIVERMNAEDPDRVFALDVDGGSLTWRQLYAEGCNWADRLVTLGVKRGDVICTMLDAGLNSLSLWFGLTSIGAVDASINGEFRGRLLGHAINSCSPELIIADAHYLQALNDCATALESVGRVLVTQTSASTPMASTAALPRLTYLDTIGETVGAAQAQIASPRWHDIACVTFTSGTTGPSKAVRLPWGQLLSINCGSFPLEDLDANDILYCFTSHAHFGSKSIPYQAAMIGGRVVMRSRFSLSHFWPDIQRFEITSASLVGSMADMLMQSADSPPRRTTLRNMFMAPLGSSYRQFAERFGLRICTVYNSTENGVPLCSGWNPDHANTVGKLRRGFPGFEVRLVDADDFEVPDGTPGECIVRTAVPWTTNAGYLNNPEATATAWRNGWFHTGDALMRTPDGNYIFVDRLKDVIRRRGENISSFEVEADVRANPNVAECAAVAVPADTNEDEILLFVRLRADAEIDEETLCADLEARMPRFMIPRYIEIIEQFPKTQATERIVKAELRSRGVGPRTWDRTKQASPSLASAISAERAGLTSEG